MEMTEALAATIAAVAPVVLLAAVVEINNNRQHVKDIYEGVNRPFGVARELFRAGEPTAEEAAAALRSLAQSPARKGFWLLIYVVSAVFVTVMLFAAELRSLAWLANVPMGSSRDEAFFCLIAVGAGFAWVCFAPVLALLVPITGRSFAGMVGFRDYWRLLRLARQHRSESVDGQQVTPDSPDMRQE
ncbi:hypothetical protein ACIP4S_03970 [Streptomyces chartreusis]|uniref:hypothetical protein n=1 Tax=Streptomyces chartreusis TaxID=1969 RepID=UPI003811B69D